MTIVAGFPGNGFVVLAADSDESGSTTKSSVRKLAVIDKGDCKVIVGGAGNGDTIDLATQLINGSLQPPYSVSSVSALIENVVTHIYSARIDSYPEYQRPGLEFQLLAAVWVKDDPEAPQLIRVRRGFYLARFTAEAIGAGSDLARYLIATLADNRGIAQAYRMAAYLIAQVKRYAVHCGGKTQVIGITADGVLVDLWPSTIKQYEDSADLIMSDAAKFLFYLTDPINAQLNKVDIDEVIDFAAKKMKEELAKMVPKLPPAPAQTTADVDVASSEASTKANGETANPGGESQPM